MRRWGVERYEGDMAGLRVAITPSGYKEFPSETLVENMPSSPVGPKVCLNVMPSGRCNTVSNEYVGQTGLKKWARRSEIVAVTAGSVPCSPSSPRRSTTVATLELVSVAVFSTTMPSKMALHESWTRHATVSNTHTKFLSPCTLLTQVIRPSKLLNVLMRFISSSVHRSGRRPSK